jgi:nitroreductase/NAD-dependent dihydropyrimidine dehydrogenase PreA subunit
VKSIVIDPDRCTTCGACVAECPIHVLTLAQDRVTVEAAERCIVCAHCVAVCAPGAVSLTDLPGAGIELDQALAVDRQALAQLIRSRRSIRAYTDEPVADEDLALVLDVARYAPSAHNAQAWHFNVIRGRDKLAPIAAAIAGFLESVLTQLTDARARESLAAVLPPGTVETLQAMTPTFRLIVEAHRQGMDVIFRGAPAAIVIHAPRSAHSGVEDAHYAAANIMLMAHGMGLGTCLIGFLVGPARYNPAIGAAAGVPKANEIGAALTVGHPKHAFRRIPPRREPPVRWI